MTHDSMVGKRLVQAVGRLCSLLLVSALAVGSARAASLNVCPSVTSNNSCDAAACNLETFTQCSCWHFACQLADFSNSVISQSGLRVSFAFLGASLENHVSRIRGAVPEKQVVRSDASRVVAFVQDADASRQRCPVIQLDGQPMSQLCTVFANTKLAITAVVFTANPNPAAISFYNFLPEAFCQRQFTRSGAKLSLSNFHGYQH
jgi:hypothetical protein